MSSSFTICPQCLDMMFEYYDDEVPHNLSCSKCHRYVCSKECADDFGLKVLDSNKNNKTRVLKDCPYCRNEKATMFQLFEFALAKLNITKEELEDEWVVLKKDL